MQPVIVVYSHLKFVFTYFFTPLTKYFLLFRTVVLPERAYVLDWVFADGPPGTARNFDNNDRQDFHAILPNNKTEIEYWMEEEERIYMRLQQERREREEAVKRKVS